MTKYILIILMLLAPIAGASADNLTPSPISIVPCPVRVVPGKGNFTFSDKTVFSVENHEQAVIARNFIDLFKKSSGIIPQLTMGSSEKSHVRFTTDSSLKSEAYLLEVTPQQILVKASDTKGFFYALQTIRLLLPPAIEGNQRAKCLDWNIPTVTIQDEPRFGYRALMLDVARFFIPKENVLRIIDCMAMLKINTLHFHLTDDNGWRLEIKKYPRLTETGAWRVNRMDVPFYFRRNPEPGEPTPIGGFYTQEDVKEMVAYAAERQIEIFPEIDMPAHSNAALAAYPELGCTGGPYEVWRMWGVSDNVLCAGNDKTIQFIKDVLAEIIEIFPSEYIHVGGDECPKDKWKTCPKCQARIKALGIKGDSKHSKEEYLQSYVIREAEKFLNEHGRNIIGWDEILEGGLAPNATVMSWRGESGGIEAARQKHNVIMTPNTYLYFDYYQAKDTETEPLAIGGYLPMERVYSYEPMPSALTPEEQKYITGVQANLWTEYIPTFAQAQYMVLPRMAALCETQWSAPDKKKDYEGFLKRTVRLMDIYKLKGWNYATHILDVKVNIAPNQETGKLDVSAYTVDNAPIYYTLDGTEPTAASLKYEDGLSIDQACVLRMTAVRPEGNSRITCDTISFSKSTAKPISMLQPINKAYEFNGAPTLVDGMTGNRNYKTGHWIAFYKNDMEAVIDLKEATEISSMTLRACVEKGDWIFDARGISVEVSDDNKAFKQVASESYPAMKETDPNQIYVHTLNFTPVKTRYVKVKALSEKSIPAWHGGKGNPGYLFVDEIILN